MDPGAFFILIGIGFAVYLFYHMRKSYREGYQRGQAEAVDKGAKPWGKPMGFAYGSAYIMTPEQIISEGIGVAPDEFQRRLNNPLC